MKLMVRVRPGVELTCASFWPSRELIRLDLPTLERPRKANSGGPSKGNSLGSAAEARNLAMIGLAGKVYRAVRFLVEHSRGRLCSTSAALQVLSRNRAFGGRWYGQ